MAVATAALSAVDLDLALLDAVDELLLTHPLSLVASLFFAQCCDLLVELLELHLVVLTADSLTLDLELGDTASDLVEPLGRQSICILRRVAASFIRR